MNSKYYSSFLTAKLTAIIIPFFLVSCVGPTNTEMVPITRQKANLIYCSNSPNIPMLQKKGSGQLSFSGSFGNNYNTFNGGEVQTAIAAGKHIGVMLNGFIAARRNQEASHNNKASFLDAGVGYFDKLTNRVSFEFYGGIGTGTTNNDHFTGYSKIKSTKFFLQPSIGYAAKTGKFKAGTAIRFSQNKFTIKEQLFDPSREDFNAIEFSQLSEHPNQFLIEPSAIIRYGWNTVQFQFQYSRLLQTGERDYNMGKVRWTLGLIFQFN